MKKISYKSVIVLFILSIFFTACEVSAKTKPQNEPKIVIDETKPENEIPLTFLAEQDGTITINKPYLFINLKYTINDGYFKSVNSDSSAVINVSAGDKVRLYAEGSNSDSNSHSNIAFSADCNIYGNIMSLLSSDYKNAIEITSDGVFCFLFCNNSHLKNNPTKELVLPATTLTRGCYSSMFQGCTLLTRAPKLPATTLAAECYSMMFSTCTSLTEAPELPATSMEPYCYYLMFSICKSLEEAPDLPAMTLANRCYQEMFESCSSLTNAPDLPATTLAYGCYSHMFTRCKKLNSIKCLATNVSEEDNTSNWLLDVSSSGEFITPSKTKWTTGDSGIPTGWTRVKSN